MYARESASGCAGDLKKALHKYSRSITWAHARNCVRAFARKRPPQQIIAVILHIHKQNYFTQTTHLHALKQKLLGALPSNFGVGCPALLGCIPDIRDICCFDKEASSNNITASISNLNCIGSENTNEHREMHDYLHTCSDVGECDPVEGLHPFWVYNWPNRLPCAAHAREYSNWKIYGRDT